MSSTVMIRLLSAVTVIALFPAANLAEGLLYKLPDDGHWVRFAMDGKGTLIDGSDVTIVGTLTMSSVGTAEVDGQPCRWIEIVVEAERGGKPFVAIDKLLIPEEHIGVGKEPLNHVLEAWRKNSISDDSARQIRTRNLQNLRAMLHGPYETTEEIDAANIETKLGNLECKGITASEKLRYSAYGRTQDSTYVIRLHDKAPFGVVTWEADTKSEGNGRVTGTMTMKMKVTDFGTDAKSVIEAQTSRTER